MCNQQAKIKSTNQEMATQTTAAVIIIYQSNSFFCDKARSEQNFNEKQFLQFYSAVSILFFPFFRLYI